MNFSNNIFQRFGLVPVPQSRDPSDTHVQALLSPPQVLGWPGLAWPLQAFPWSGLVMHTQGQIKIIGTFTLVFSSCIFETGASAMLILNRGGRAKLFLKSAFRGCANPQSFIINPQIANTQISTKY